MTTSVSTGVDRFVQIGALNLHYLEWGDSNASPVVMIHGLSGNAHAFDHLVSRFLPKYHVVSLDVRGRGDSGWAPDGDYSNDSYVADLDGFCQALGLQRFSLVGTSMGGRISMSYAGKYPDRVVRAVLNDIGPEVDPRGGNRIAAGTREAVSTFPNLDEVVEWHRQQRPTFNQLSDEDQRISAGHAVKPLEGGGFAWKMDPAARSDPRRPDPESQWALAKNIPCPVLLFRGAESDLLSPEIAQRMVDEMQNCRMVEVPGVGHTPTMLEREAFPALQEFFGLP